MLKQIESTVDRRTARSTADPAELVYAAAAGDQDAWNALVDRYSGLVWSIARAFRLSAEDAADVSQTTWLRLVQHLERLREPDRVGAWLASTARRECLRVLRHANRRALDVDVDIHSHLDPPAPDQRLVRSEQHSALLHALGALPPRSRRFLLVLMADPPPSYVDVAAALDMPIGSIGPTRGRILEQLRKRLDEQGFEPALG